MDNQQKLDENHWLLSTDEGREWMFEQIATRTASKILNQEIPREGLGAQIPGNTNLAALIAWHDDGTLQLIAAVAAVAAAAGGDTDQIKMAVLEALKDNVVQVEISVPQLPGTPSANPKG